MEELKNSEISHQGTIISIEDKHINVRIISMAGCVSCSVSGSCSASDLAEKIVEVVKPNNNTYKIGDHVSIVLNQAMGLKAVFLGYVAPFLVILFTLITMLSFNISEGISGIISLLMLIPYFGILFLLKKRIKDNFSFRLK